MPSSPISAVIFDCDGVLVDSEVLALEVEIGVLGEAGLHYDRRDFVTRFTGMSNKAFYAALEADALKLLGRSILPVVHGEMRTRYEEAFATRLTEVAGALDAITAVRHPKAVASSSSASGLEFKLRKVGHWDHFAPHVYSADHVERAKPAPDLFFHAANALGIEPAGCLVIEDSLNGVNAAKAAGMRVWGFTGGGHMDDEAGARLLANGAERLIAGWLSFSAEFAKQ